MPETLISGAEGVITINSDPLVVANTVDFSVTRNIMEKSFVGQAWGESLNGQRRATFSASGSVSAETMPLLYAALDATSVPITVQIGDGSGETDAGVFEGEFSLSNLSITVAGDGEWDFSLEGTNVGPVTYTPPSP